MKFVTTNVRLEEPMMKELKLKAIHERRRIADLVREAVASYLHELAEPTRFSSLGKGMQEDPLLHIAGLYESGDPRSYERIDETLYGRKR